ncbi:hypothetical protein NR640_006641 [Pseudomonas aeruginosa]|nr:hypothetical protein [Pseudomonas aeruginosa]EKY0762967.1 hypothetical protein [Pseudomonas aeruginosa]
MNDRTLLELAARAAGYQFSYSYRSLSSPAVPVILAETGRWRQWDPRHDYSEALMLAVRLNFTVSICDEFTKVTHGFEEGIIEYADGHKEFATCMAITRAAAEIGKSMGGGE